MIYHQHQMRPINQHGLQSDDKTESVRKYKIKYGNNAKIAKMIWITIINPIREEDISILADPKMYQSEYNRLLKNITTNDNNNGRYYQRKKKITGSNGMRAFNNWLKMNIIVYWMWIRRRFT